ncbi:hypothetical protein CW304_06845 [Bacillus sp. UFRGS-B20]|nr:hypothetical protein CW304_06845 [Bacillus sp. UFRGS-B20]
MTSNNSTCFIILMAITVFCASVNIPSTTEEVFLYKFSIFQRIPSANVCRCLYRIIPKNR